MYGEILALAKRDEEKRIALDVLKQVISAESLALAVENLDKPALQEAAARVAVTISQKLVAAQPAAVAKAMEKVLQVTKNKDLSAKATASWNGRGRSKGIPARTVFPPPLGSPQRSGGLATTGPRGTMFPPPLGSPQRSGGLATTGPRDHVPAPVGLAPAERRIGHYGARGTMFPPPLGSPQRSGGLATTQRLTPCRTFAHLHSGQLPRSLSTRLERFHLLA